jgi:CBS domain-containing membrane protein
MRAISMGTMIEARCVAAKLDTTIHQLWQLLGESDVRQVPVTDGDGKVVGMISHRDLALAAYRAGLKGARGQREALLESAVAHVMSRQVMSVEGHSAADSALQAMVAHRFSSIPITDEGRLVGTVSSSDFLRKVAYGNWAGHDEPIRLRMRSPGHTIDANDTLERAFEAAEWHAQEYVIAVRRYRPLGILSRTAMRLALYLESTDEESQRMKTTPVHLLLQTLPVLHPETTLGAAALTMLEHRARALPVVDRSRLLLGILTEDDVLQAMVAHANA